MGLQLWGIAGRVAWEDLYVSGQMQGTEMGGWWGP